jgi:hydroxyacylglutathione hydrolase
MLQVKYARKMSNQSATHATPLRVRPVPAFADNYIWLIEAPGRPGSVVAVDPGEAGPVETELDLTGSQLAAILLTHHHPDHIGGVTRLLERGSVPVIGPDDGRIPVRTRTARDGERCELPELGLAFDILAVPGHTLSHIAFWGHGALFCGDTLFSAGCGRMFEGTPVQMNASLSRLKNLPPDTAMYCGHEYTAANLKFALTVEPGNRAALDYQEKVRSLRDAGAPTLPSRMALERQVNPFLRCDEPAVRDAAGVRAGRRVEAAAEVFGVLRAWKDQFR